VHSYAQTGNLRTKWVKVTPGPTVIDTLSLSPSTLKVLSPADPSLRVTYDPNRNTVQFTGNRLPDSVLVSYRTFPADLTKPVFHRDPKSYDTVVNFGGKDPLAPVLRERREEFFATKGITKSGSLTRGLSFGNAQNVFVNSALNLQLEGQLSEDVSIQAVISDQNVPYQPEGNTQQLRDFDRVFVQLTGKGWKLLAGDVVLRNPGRLYGGYDPSHFLRYYRSVQGGQAEASYSAVGGGRAVTSVGVAVSKGKFASMQLPVNEGVQGPYRLRGPGNERFIIVLANSERVYLDGRLLQRGFNADYVIDYNTAEITFTPAVVITAYSRVRVDFEYSDRNYSRTILAATHRQEAGKFRFFSNFYREKDNPRNPLALQLTDAEKLVLQAVGDQATGALLPAITETESYNPALVSYRRADTLVDGQAYEVYVQSDDPALARYQVQFTEVEPGQGSYELLRTTANGRVYAWVTPHERPIKGRGRFEPVRLVPLPTQRQVLTVGGELVLNASESVFAEGAFSKLDQNLYSPLNAEDDNGQAFKAGYVNRGKRLRWLPGYEWVGGLDFERDSRYFRPIDRFRPVEFDRDWSIEPTDTLPADDHIFNVTLGVQRATRPVETPAPAMPDSTQTIAPPPDQPPPAPTEHPLAPPQAVTGATPAPSSSFLPLPVTDRLVYRFSRRQRGPAVNGWQQRLEGAKTLGRLFLQGDAFLLRSEKENHTSEWTRLQATASYRTRLLTPGYAFSLDKNRLVSRHAADSVTGAAVHFEENRVFLRTADSLKTRWGADYSIRQDYVPLEGRMVKNTLARMATTGLQTRLGGDDLNVTATYRTLHHLHPTRELPAEETMMGRLDWNGNWLARTVRSELTYAAATGRELRREYVFLPVPTGAGTHAWRDDNGDGKQQLNEFYEAINPDEKNFAKFFVPTDDYVRAYTQNFSYRLNLTPPPGWKNQGPLQSVLGRLSSVSAWTINRKTTDEHGAGRWVPFVPTADSALLSAQESVRSALFYNRSSPRYGLDLNWLRTQNRQLLTGGYEARDGQEWRLNGRFNLGRDYSLKGTLSQSLRGNRSDFLENRNYRVQAQQAGPELAYQPRADFRITGSYLYSLKRNVVAEGAGENAVSNAVSLETRWAKVSKRTLTATARWTQIRFNGQTNSPLGYELLEALQPGTNWNWAVNWQQRLANGLQLTVNYEGRQSGGQRVVHIGRMMVSALF
jgi:hypothetical protein